ncbi:MAG: flagellar hook-length control protein FliK [Desulfobulbus sp.]
MKLSSLLPFTPASQSGASSLTTPATLVPGTHDRQGRLPLAQGQVVLGTVTAQNSPNQFTLTINGQQIATETGLPLQVGQTLNLQVTSLTPQLTLQFLGNAPATTNTALQQRIGASLHLIGQQTTLLHTLPQLADTATQLPLSSGSQATLRLFETELGFGSRHAEQPSALLVRIVDAALAALVAGTTTDSATVRNQYQAIGQLLTQLARLPGIAPQTALHIDGLAKVFLQAAASSSTLTTSAQAAAPGDPANTTAGNPQPPASTDFGTLSLALEKNLPQLARATLALPTTHPLRQLSSLLEPLASKTRHGNAEAPVRVDGQQLETLINRLGLNMERLFSENRQEEAVQTLKFALLELAQHAAAQGTEAAQAEQMSKTLELYQMLQVRLNNEAFFFLPLPFLFLKQGFLLIDATPQDGKKKNGAAPNPVQTVTMQLQLAGLGNLEITIHQNEQAISLVFRAEDLARARYLAAFREELKQWLTAGTLDSVQFLTGAQDPTRVLAEKMLHGTSGLVRTTT